MMRVRDTRSAAAIPVLVVIALGLALLCTASGQQMTAKERDRQVRLAKDLARAGNRDAALASLEQLYGRVPEDAVVVRALFEMLLTGERYDRAEEVIKHYLSGRSGDVKANADLAALYFKTGRKDEGIELIEGIVRMAPDEPWPYETSLRVLTGNKLDEDALAWIARARAALGDSILFARDASRINANAGRYMEATREQLRSAVDNDRTGEVEAEHIIVMARNDEARPGVIAGLERARSVDAFKPVVRRALWEIYLIDGDCSLALGELKGMIEQDKTTWRYCPVLARRALEVGCYEECRRAYAMAVRYATDKSKIPDFLMGQAQCEVRAGLLEQALETYDRLVDKYADSQWAAKAAVERAGIYRRLGRLDEAAVEAERVIANSQAGEARYEAILFKADCLVEAGRLDAAFETYDLVEETWKPGYAQEAFFNLGELSLYKAEFDEAESYYNVTLRQFSDEPRANDAVERLMLLKASKAGEAYVPDLRDLAEASLLRRQGRTDDAAAIFDKLARSEGEIKVESLRSLSEMYLERGDFDEAIRTYKIIAESLDTRHSPGALEAAGDIYLDRGVADEAIRIYEDVILRFPDSVAAGEARRKIEIAKRRSTGES